ncbi:MAG: ABC transporter permease, partial [Ilumatobacteraceae bacterium]
MSRPASAARSFSVVPAALLVGGVVVIPVAILAASEIHPADLVDVWSRPGVGAAVWFSLWQATLSTAFTMTFGLVPTWLVTRYRFPGRALVHLVLAAPFVLPTVVVGAAFLAVLPDAVDRSVWAIVAAHVFFNVAVVLRTVGPVWSLIDDDLLAAARTLGATPWQVWHRIIMPLARRALWASAGLIFLLCATSFGVVRILGGPGLATVDVEIYRRAVQLGDTSGATVLAIAQTLAIAAVVTISLRRRQSAPTILDRARAARSTRPARWSQRVGVYTAASIMSVPLVALVLASVRTNDGFSWRAWRVLLGLETVSRLQFDLRGVVTTSLLFALVATSLAVPIGLAAAMSLMHRPRSSVLTSLLVLPLGTSAVVVGFGILVTYDADPFDLRARWWLIPLVHAAIALPFVVRTVLPVLESIPADLRNAAATLGASPRRRFWMVDLPVMRPAVTSAAAMSGALSLGEFGATSFLTRRDTETLPIAVVKESVPARPSKRATA